MLALTRAAPRRSGYPLNTREFRAVRGGDQEVPVGETQERRIYMVTDERSLVLSARPK